MAMAHETFMVGGMQPLTLIDFPGRLATVIFGQGCNLRCRFCYNRSLLSATSNDMLPWAQVLDFLRDRQGFIEGVVFSGGEPCLQSGLLKAMTQVRELGFEIALHTNGFYPEIVKMALEQRLLHFIAVDFKAPFARYHEITGQPADEEAFTAVAEAIVASGVKHEYRTTVHPQMLKDADVMVMADWLASKKISNYALQKFKHGGALDQSLTPVNGSWLSPATILKIRSRFSGFEIRSDSSIDTALPQAA